MTTLATLERYSQGHITRRQALDALRFQDRDYPQLLRLLGEAGLSVPVAPQSDAMAEDFAALWRQL